MAEVRQRRRKNKMEEQKEIKEEKVEVKDLGEETKVSWDEAIDSGNFVKLEEDKPITLVITEWELVKVHKKFGGEEEEKVEFRSKVIEENGVAVEKSFNTVSNRLKKKLKERLQDKKPEEKVKLKITKIGDKFNTNYSVIEG